MAHIGRMLVREVARLGAPSRGLHGCAALARQRHTIREPEQTRTGGRRRMLLGEYHAEAERERALSHLDAQITILAREGRASDIEELVTAMQTKGLPITEPIFLGVFTAYLQCGDADKAADVLLRMISAGFAVRIVMCRAVLAEMLANGNEKRALEFCETLKSKGVLPKRSSVAKLMAYQQIPPRTVTDEDRAAIDRLVEQVPSPLGEAATPSAPHVDEGIDDSHHRRGRRRQR
jgi:hypothetical protein